MVRETETKIAIRPASPTPGDRGSNGIRPYELDPELAQIKIAEILIGKMGTPAVISRPFVVRYGLFHALNHTEDLFNEAGILVHPGNKTGYDSSLRLQVYRKVAAESVNIDGRYFNNVWAYLMKPKYIIQGMSMMPNQFEDDKKESVVGRVMNFFRGGGKKNEQSNTP
jgi:hypothetical protein